MTSSITYTDGKVTGTDGTSTFNLTLDNTTHKPIFDFNSGSAHGYFKSTSDLSIGFGPFSIGYSSGSLYGSFGPLTRTLNSDGGYTTNFSSPYFHYSTTEDKYGNVTSTKTTIGDESHNAYYSVETSGPGRNTITEEYQFPGSDPVSQVIDATDPAGIANSAAARAVNAITGGAVDKIRDYYKHQREAIDGQEQIDIATNTNFQTALTPPRRDPLAIDLDADGIETVGLPTIGSPILFDHDADGIKTGTGWLKGDDAWLVLDRNGNGSIDSGRELFGVDTLITVTEKLPGASVATTFARNASSGFEALRSIDSNADNVFNSSDPAFTQVHLWQDFNQDGISQSNELFTLADKGITSIALNATPTSTNLGNGNTVTGVATVTRSTGATTIDSVDLTASNLTLGSNPFYRSFTDTIPLTDTALALPEMGGSGVLRDLREAMSLGTAQAAALVVAVQAFAQALTRDEQVALLDTVIEAWAKTGPDLDVALRGITGSYGLLTSTTSNTGQAAFDSLFGTKLDALGLSWRGLLTNTDFRGSTFNADTLALIDMAHNAGVLTEVRAINNGTGGFNTYVGAPLYQGIDSLMGVQRHIAVLDEFNGMGVLNRLVAPGATIGGTLHESTLGVLWPTGNALMEQAYEALRTSVYTALTTQTRLEPYLDAVTLVIDGTGIHFDTTALVAKLDAYRSIDVRNALIDLVELNRYATPTLQAVEFDGMQFLRGWIDALPASSPLRTELATLDVLTGSVTTGSTRTDIYFGDAGANSFSAGTGDDLLDGGLGNDGLYGGIGADTLTGGAGNDGLYGDGGYGGAGGNDKLNGGAGNDMLMGGFGSDTYLFGRGDGQDAINNDSDAYNGYADPDITKRDVLQFKAGILVGDVALSRSGDALIVKINGTTDQVTISNYFISDGVSTRTWAVEQIKFNDGTIWDVATVKAMMLKVAPP